MNDDKITIAAFGFDGTITQKDTLFDFIVFCFGKFKLFSGLLLLSPVFILFKLGIIKYGKAKQLLFSFFYKKTDISDFDKKCNDYAQRISDMLNMDIIEKIKWHQDQKHIIAIISTSVSNWIKPWALIMYIDVIIGTEVNVVNNELTGKFSPENCYGPEKVKRLCSYFPERDKYILYVYGDRKRDKELLEFADYPCLPDKHSRLTS